VTFALNSCSDTEVYQREEWKAMGKKKTWGGAREGAGRPSKHKEACVANGVSLPLNVWKFVDKMSARTGESRSSLITDALISFWGIDDEKGQKKKAAQGK
jgi:hypothetical protein